MPKNTGSNPQNRSNVQLLSKYSIMIKYPKPSRLITTHELMKNKLLSFFHSKTSRYKKHLIFWRIQLIAVKDMIRQFWLGKQVNKIIHNFEDSKIENLEDPVTRYFVTVPLLTLIWMYFFYRWPAYHP